MNKEIINHINKGQVYAIIPARSGSKGVKNKNIRLLNGYPLIAYTIAAAKLSHKIDRVIVSTDSREYADIAVKYGAEVPFLRPAEISGDTSTDCDLIMHAINWFYKNEGTVPEFFAHLLVTCPFRIPVEIDNAVSTFSKSDNEFTSLMSAQPSDVCGFKLLFMKGDNEFHSISERVENNSVCNPRQSFQKTYFQDGCISIYRCEYVVTNEQLRGEKMMSFVASEGVDIDTEADFAYAASLMEDTYPLYNYLKNNF